MFLTAQLVFTIFMLATEKHEGTFIAPVGIGLSLFVAELMGVYYTGGSVNPARSFGPAVVSHSFHSYHWIYWVGPILGAFLASAFYMFIKACKYQHYLPSYPYLITATSQWSTRPSTSTKTPNRLLARSLTPRINRHRTLPSTQRSLSMTRICLVDRETHLRKLLPWRAEMLHTTVLHVTRLHDLTLLYHLLH